MGRGNSHHTFVVFTEQKCIHW